MRLLILLVVSFSLVAPANAAKKLKPKYYKACYAEYKEMRALVPKPAMDVQKTAKTVNAVAGIAGRFGGLGGLGSAAATASTVAQYSQTIADVAAFTQNMTESFPNTSDRYIAYGDRMGDEAGDMERVADFAMNSQECYAGAYAELKAGVESGEIKKKDVKKRHKEITTGVGNISEMLDHAAVYMDTNISAYNQALTQETTGAGLDLNKILSLAGQAQSVTTQVKGLTPGSGDGWAGTGWTPSEVRIAAHRQAMMAQYQAAGIPIPDASAQSAANLIGSFGSLSQIATLGSVSPGVAAHLAVSKAVGAQSGNAETVQQASAPAADAGDQRLAALAEAGTDVQPYLDSFSRIKALAQMQKGFAGAVKAKP